MTPRPAPPAPEAVAQALALVLKSMEDSEPAGDLDGRDIESRMTHFNRLVSRCQVAGEALQLATQREAALFRRQRNALLPINRLPPELLSAILIKSVTLWERRGSQLLAQVAWQWWQTIKSDPQFWTHITPPLRGVELQTRKAGILPLSLYWLIDMESKDRDAFKDLLQRYAERWTTIVVADSDCGMDALEVLYTSLSL
ncbi:hypothetical protein FRC04_004216 [Tulasnella sp. 424]|nr:hypothetical protein FRC04_004216 [Tulasnella sp. 424]